MKYGFSKFAIRFFYLLSIIAFLPATRLSAQAPLTKEKIQAALDEAYNKFKNLKEGKNADYIKELANVDPNIFGIALVTTDGKTSWTFTVLLQEGPFL